MIKLILFLLLLLFSSIYSYLQNDENDYYKIVINTGEKPECIRCNSKVNTGLDNFLRVDATGASDVVVKIMHYSTDQCIRCVFIKAGSIYSINNIPEGVYYLKIAYGYEWSKKVVGSFCFAKFVTDAHYQVGNDLTGF